jgi:hypothetical protein
VETALTRPLLTNRSYSAGNRQPADISARTKKELANENKPRTLPSTGDLDEAIALSADAMPEGVYP